MKNDPFLQKLLGTFGGIVDDVLERALEGPTPPTGPETVIWTRKAWKGNKFVLHTLLSPEGEYETLFLSRMYTAPNMPPAMNLVFKTTPIMTLERYNTKEEAAAGHEEWVQKMSTAPPERIIDLAQTRDTAKLDRELGAKWRLQALAVA